MRWSLVGGAILALGFSSATLAEGTPARRAAYQAPQSWSGFYFGVNGGYGWGRAETSISGITVPLAIAPFGGAADVDGWIGGGQVGFNLQAEHLVFGIEADLQWSGKDGSATFCSTAACGPGAVFVTASHDQNWFGTLRARAGVLPDPRLLFYVTGGVAYSSFDTDYTVGIVAGPAVTFSDDKKKGGWVIGGGAEWKIHRNLTMKAEYLYIDYGAIGGGASASAPLIVPNAQQVGFAAVVDATADGSLRTQLTDQIVRIGLNYKFGERDYRPLK